MSTNYHTDQRPAYECSSRGDRLTTPSCRSVAAASVDDAVAGALLDALTPEQVALALAAADEVTGQHQRVSRAAELAVERARYEADRAERAFCAGRAGEPAGRPHPGGPLGGQARRPRRGRAGAAGRPGHAAAAAQPGRAGETRRRPARPVARAHHQRQGPQTAAAHPDRRRHRAARARPGQGPDRDPLAHRRHRRAHRRPARPPRHRQAFARPPPVELVRRLGSDHQQRRAGRPAERRRADRTGHGRPFDIDAVQWIRHAYKIPAPDPYGPGEISVAEAARRLGCSTGVIYHWIHTGQLTARRGSGQPVLHPLGRPGRGRLPHQDRPVRPPGPGRPPPHAPRARVPRCRRRRGQRHRSRLPARLQHRGHLLLDRNRAAQRPPRRREPAAHPLERPDPGTMPQPHRPIRASQPRRPPHQAPPAALRQPRMSVPPAMLASPGPPRRA